MANVDHNFENSAEAPPVGLKIGDIYFVLFRHRWKILFFVLAGIAAAAFLYKTTPQVYFSEAKLLVRYVTDTRSGQLGRSEIALILSAQFKFRPAAAAAVSRNCCRVLTSRRLSRLPR